MNNRAKATSLTRVDLRPMMAAAILGLYGIATALMMIAHLAS